MSIFDEILEADQRQLEAILGRMMAVKIARMMRREAKREARRILWGCPSSQTPKGFGILGESHSTEVIHYGD